MTPQEIESKEFFVAARGYEREEVRAFLRTVAEEQRSLLAAAAARAALPVQADPLTTMGDHVVAVMRAAEQSADGITSQAEHAAAKRREEIELERVQLLADAAEQATRTVAMAESEAARMREDALQTAREEVTALVGEAMHRREELLRACEVLAARLEAAILGARASISDLDSEVPELTVEHEVIDLRETEISR